jgi:hypothetical protein
MTFKDQTGNSKTTAATLMAFFRKPEQTVSEFSAELKALQPEEKQELAVGAANEMGWIISE